MEGAVELFAVRPPDQVTISELVQQAGMTPAAFYYHFKSREDLLHEVVHGFAEQWAAIAEAAFVEVRSPEELLSAADAAVDRASEPRDHATVYFVTSRGVTVGVEEARRDATTRVAAAISAALCRVTGAESGARTGLDGVSVATVLESALRSELALDGAYRALGPRRFRDEVLEVVRRVVALPAS